VGDASSVAGRTARPGPAFSNATKWGLNGWSEALRQELQPMSARWSSTDHITHPDSRPTGQAL
jgi:NADP-dependent 3-hydroxy acid dehydrogenase YdfG